MTTRANLPTLTKLPRKAKAPRPCECGCAVPTRGGRFLPGHDAILAAWALRVQRGAIAQAPEPHTEAVADFLAKRGVAHTPLTGRAKKEAKRAARQAARELAARAAAVVADTDTGTDDAPADDAELAAE